MADCCPCFVGFFFFFDLEGDYFALIVHLFEVPGAFDTVAPAAFGSL